MPYRDPEKRRASVREAVRRHAASKAGKPKPRAKPLPELAELRFQTAKDVLDVLQEQLVLVRRARVGVLERARVVGYLASVALRACESADLDARLASLESTVSMMGRGGVQ